MAADNGAAQGHLRGGCIDFRGCRNLTLCSQAHRVENSGFCEGVALAARSFVPALSHHQVLFSVRFKVFMCHKSGRHLYHLLSFLCSC